LRVFQELVFLEWSCARVFASFDSTLINAGPVADSDKFKECLSIPDGMLGVRVTQFTETEPDVRTKLYFGIRCSGHRISGNARGIIR
jgi:hypothetical protein